MNGWMVGGRDDSGESLLVLPSTLCKAQWGVLPFLGEGLGLPWHRSLETLNPLRLLLTCGRGSLNGGGGVFVSPRVICLFSEGRNGIQFSELDEQSCWL